jgi:hypothetical protein
MGGEPMPETTSRVKSKFYNVCSADFSRQPLKWLLRTLQNFMFAVLVHYDINAAIL